VIFGIQYGDWPFGSEMLYTLRKARFTELALALASVLTVLASLGLHPEPAVAGPPSPVPAWETSARTASGAHECPVCLAHRTVSLQDPSPVVLEPIASVPALWCRKISPPQRPDSSPHAGRAPPSA